MLVSIGIVFLIMVITFKSIKAPIAILCSLPLAAIGAILGIVISGISVDITALLGALMLIGSRRNQCDCAIRPSQTK